jgi:hypothetical protein
MENTFFALNPYSRPSQGLQDFCYMSYVIRLGFKIDKNIVKVSDYWSVEILPKYIINQYLKYYWSVSQTERHN